VEHDVPGSQGWADNSRETYWLPSGWQIAPAGRSWRRSGTCGRS